MVAGGCGFLGTNLCRRHAAAGNRVHAFDRRCMCPPSALIGRKGFHDGWQAMREAEGPHPATGVALPHLVVQSGMFWDPRRQKISDPRALRLWAATPRGPLTVGRGSRRAARQCPPR